MVMQVRRRLGSAGAPTTLADGQFGYNDPGTAANDAALYASDDSLYIGSEDSNSDPVVRLLVGASRQVELAGAQTITGAKTFSPTSFHLTGGANNNILTTDGSGGVSWTAAPSGGLLSVTTDGVTISGDGTSGDALSVIKLPTARNIGLQAAGAQGDGSITTIAATAASFDGSANADITAFRITRLDDGQY